MALKPIEPEWFEAVYDSPELAAAKAAEHAAVCQLNLNRLKFRDSYNG